MHLKYRPVDKQIKVAKENLDFYIPFAHASGVNILTKELHNICQYILQTVYQNKLKTHSSFLSYNNSAILERKLKNNLKASVGVLLYYTNDRQESFTLLGKERADKCDGATWCELGGSVQVGESFLEAAIREVEEESGGVYKLKSSDLLTNGVVYYNAHSQKDGRVREEVYVILKVDNYYPVDLLCRVVSQQGKDTYREKDDFKWIACNHLCMVAHNPCTLQDIDGNAHTLTLRKFFYSALRTDPFRMKLLSIME